MSINESKPKVRHNPFLPMTKDYEKEYIRDVLGSHLFPESQFPDLPEALDWERLARLLDNYRLTTHFLVLGADHLAHWDTAFVDQLKRDRYSSMFYGDQCNLYVRQLLRALTDADIPVIVMKGWAFIPILYGSDHSQRICEDIDILVRPQDVDAVEAILADLRFEMEMESWPGYHRLYRNGVRYFAPVPEGFPGRGFSVGFHWGLWHVPSYDANLIDMEALFERTHSLYVAGFQVSRLSVEDEIIYLAAHTVLHHLFENNLFRYYELAAVILEMGDTVQWGKVLERAERWDVLLALQHVLEEITELWGELVPAQVLEKLSRMRGSRREHFVMNWIKMTRANSSLLHLLYWLTFPIWWQRGLIVLQDIFPGRDYLAYRYGKAPGGIWPLLYGRRFWHALRFLVERFAFLREI